MVKKSTIFFLGKAVTILTIPIVLLTRSRETCFTEIYTRISYFAFFVLHVGICMLCILNYEQSWCSVGQTFVYVNTRGENKLFFGNFLLAKLLFSMLEAALLLFYTILDRNRLLGRTASVKWHGRLETFISDRAADVFCFCVRACVFDYFLMEYEKF